MALVSFLPINAVVKDVVFIDDDTLVTGSRDFATMVWDITDSPEILQTLQRRGLVVALGKSADGLIVIVELGSEGGASGGVNVVTWDRANQESVNRVSSGYVFDGEYSPEKGILALQTWSDSIIIVDAQRMRATSTCVKCVSPALSPDGSLLAAYKFMESRMVILDATSQEEIAVFEEASSPLSFSPDGKLLLSRSATGLSLWDVETTELVRTFDGDDGRMEYAAISPDGSTLASASLSGNLMLRDLASGEIRFVVEGFFPIGQAVFQNQYFASKNCVRVGSSMSVLDLASGAVGCYNREAI